MPTIAQYPRDTEINDTDLLLGADQGTMTTVTFRIMDVAAFIGNEVLDTQLLTRDNTFTGLNTFTQGIARETGGSTTDGLKIWSGTEAQYLTLTPDPNTVYYVTDI